MKQQTSNIQLSFDLETAMSGQDTESCMENSQGLFLSEELTFSSNEREKQIDELLIYFQNKPNSECLTLFREQQKSNYLKNLIRSFNRFILNDGDLVIIECLDIYQKQGSQFRQQFKKFIKRRNINNSLVKDLIMNDRFGILFKYYLEQYAIDWLKQSVKILDIKYHIFYIVFLLRSCSEHSLLENIKFYAK